jgi:NAD(P)H-quinone oxidoreductase subunit 5
MFDHEMLFRALGLTVVCAPVCMVLILGLSSLVGRPLSERSISRTVQVGVSGGLIAALTILGLMISQETRHVSIQLGNWVHIPHYHFQIEFVFDRLSVPFVILTFLLCGTIGAFANKYMHRERGFNRFFVFYSLFVLGMIVTSLAGTIETLFAGWELVGLSSALLVAYYHERPSPVRNGLRVWCVYRVSDAALLIASVALHHLTGEGQFDQFLGSGAWPEGVASATEHQAFVVGILLLIAAMGKSALVPFSGWLPRAMEGPTPSSAVFYGALSVHLGAFLLLRVSPILDLSPWLCAAVVFEGLLTAVFAAFAGRVQTDIKSALSFASMTQVGIIVAEIGLTSLIIHWTGWLSLGYVLRYLTLLHILGHGCLRTLQFLRAPTLLLDYRTLENAIGSSLPQTEGSLERRIPARLHVWFYRLALERGYLDACLDNFLVRPFVKALHVCDVLERRWTDFLSGSQSRESEQLKPTPEPLEDLI